MTTKKFIAKNGLQSQNVDFVSPNGSSTLSFSMSDTGTLSVSGTAAGQLFSITDSLAGVIHSVNNASAVPSFEVYDTGEVRLAEYGGNVGIGVASPTDKLHVAGSVRITGALKDSANSGGTSGFILSSTGSGTQWIALPSTTLTGDLTGTGSGTISTTLANTGVTAGTYKSVTVDAKGRVTGGTNPTTLSGYGITDAQALDADLTAIAALTGTSGFLKKTAANTWSLDTSTYLTGNQSITISGDVSGSGSTAITATLANSGVTAGTYSLANITVDSKGRITAASSGSVTSLTGVTSSAGPYTVALGYGAGTSLNQFLGNYNTAIGYQALNSATQSSDNVAIGYNALRYQTISGTANVVIGSNAGTGTAGSYDYTVLIGYGAGQYVQNTGTVFIGAQTGRRSSAAYSVGIGHQAFGFANSTNQNGNYCIAIGYQSLYSLQYGQHNTAVGTYAGFSLTAGEFNTIFGSRAGQEVTGSYNTLIGNRAGSSGSVNLTSGNQNIIIGNAAEPSSSTVSNEITLGNASITRFRIPGLGVDWTSSTLPLTANQTITLSGDVTGSGSTAITTTLANSGVTAGSYTLASITVDSKGRITAASSGSAGSSLIGVTSSASPYTVALGQSAGTNSTGTGNIAIGYQALDAGNSGGYGIAIGYSAASNATTSTSFVAIGLNAMLNPLSGGAYGVYIGESAGRSLTYGGSHVVIGYNAGYSMTSSNADTAVGYNALSSYSGPQGTNVALGANAGSSLTAGGNNIIIGESAQASSATISNEITFGNANITKLRVPGVGFYVGTESIASAATITPDSTDSQYNITALATDATLAAPAAGKDGQQLRIRIKDNGTARAITWTTSSGGYRAIGTTLFTSTVAGKTIYVGCIYNAADSFWDVVSVSTQA